MGTFIDNFVVLAKTLDDNSLGSNQFYILEDEILHFEVDEFEDRFLVSSKMYVTLLPGLAQ